MKKHLVLSVFLIISGFISGQTARSQDETGNSKNNMTLLERVTQGTWVKMGVAGPVSLTFTEDGTATITLGSAETLLVTSAWALSHDTLRLTDRKGNSCPEPGQYKLYPSEYSLGFDLVDDECNGRIKMVMGYWTRPDFKELLQQLDQKIAQTGDPALYLERARIFMATENARQAKADLDHYIAHDTTSARAYINRAGTRFPDDMKGVISDCTKAISLQPDQKNAYFLRGIALYTVGEEEKACKDFSRAIRLGFTVLRSAEYEKCREYWKDSKEK